MEKRILLLAMLALLFLKAKAQTPESHSHEAGLQLYGIDFGGFNSFAGIYKKKLPSGKFRRFSAGFSSITYQQDNLHDFGLSFNASLGTEKRKAVGKRTMLCLGPEFSLGTSFGKREKTKASFAFQPSFSYIIGLQYSFSEFWALNMEAGPGIGFSFLRFSSGFEFYRANFHFSSNVALTIVHTF
jgi:hypothetical protein